MDEFAELGWPLDLAYIDAEPWIQKARARLYAKLDEAA
jgi:hypothetical protein